MLAILADLIFVPSKGLAKASQLSFAKTAFCYMLFLLLVFWPVAKFLNIFAQNLILLSLFICKYFFTFFCLFIFAALLNSLADIFYKKQVKIRQIMAVTVFSLFPFLLLPVYLKLSHIEKTLDFLQLILSLWCFILLVLGIKNLYNLGIIKSFLLLILPYAFLVVFYFTALGYFMVSLLSTII